MVRGAAKLRYFLEQVPAAVAMFDADMRYLAASRRWLEDHDIISPVIGREHYELFPETPERWKAMVARALSGESPAAEEICCRRADVIRWLCWEVRPWRAADDRIGGIVAFSSDISERKRSEEALRASESRERRRAEEIQALLDTVPVGLAIALDTRGKRIRGNRANEEMFGLPPGAELSMSGSKPPHLRVSQDGRELQLDELPMQRAVRGETVRNQVVDVRCPDGRTLTMIANTAPLLDEAGRPRGAVGALLDITSLREAEEALRLADRRKDEFIATLAHELRNPLAPIRNVLNLLKLSGAETRDMKDLLSLIERQVDHLVRLVDDLLEVSRINLGKIELKKEVCDLAGVLRHAVETTEPHMHAAGQRLIVEQPSSAVTLDADPVRLAQVFANLLGNAAKYTPGGGTIRLKAEPSQDAVVVSVRDNGIGIEPELLPRVFDPFTQSPGVLGHSQRGLGLGLAIVRSLVRLHGGEVEARSEGRGRGSEFIVRLPLEAPASRPLDGRRAETAAAASSRRVLVVDDDEDVADSFALLLLSLGMEVRLAYGGAQALRISSEFKPHLAFLDIGMPGMDGFETARRLRALPDGGDIFLAALSGWGQENDRRKALAAGFDRHFVKPLKLEDLEVLLRSPLRERSRAGGVD